MLGALAREKYQIGVNTMPDWAESYGNHQIKSGLIHLMCLVIQFEPAVTAAAGQGIVKAEHVMEQMATARASCKDDQQGADGIDRDAGENDGFTNCGRPGDGIEYKD